MPLFPNKGVDNNGYGLFSELNLDACFEVGNHGSLRVMPPKAQLTIHLGFNMNSLKPQMSSSGRLSRENYYSASAE
jgi:hypothetical protein